MEANFQSDKKLLRQENMTKDKLIKELHEKLKEASLQTNIDVENLKSKFIVERHRRDKEYNDQMVMVRELQKLLADERHLKENLEMQLNDLKMQFSGTNYSDRAIKQLNSEVDMARKKLKYYENSATNDRENSVLVQQLRNEISNLKQQHAAAVKSEQKRTFLAEERNKKLAAVHEERVVNLEAKLSELSQVSMTSIPVLT
jgi:GRIP and coiled-coil domain-containing protein 1